MRIKKQLNAVYPVNFLYLVDDYLRFTVIFSAIILIFIFGCSEVGAYDDGPSPVPSDKTRPLTHLRVVIRWHGDDFASKQDLDTRHRIETLILEKGVGKIIRSGTGMGWMDIVVEVEDREGAAIAIKSIMEECAPGVTYTIEWVPSRGIE